MTTALILAAMSASAYATAAFAVGACGAYGYAHNLGYADTQANAAALAQCKDPKCRVVATVRSACIAFAIDSANPCGADGVGTAVNRSTAQNRALKQCYSHGGKSCVIRAATCD
jgi:hypothetical protein